jgi:hypothetical protein
MGPGRSQFSWDAAALTPLSSFESISSRFRAILGDFGQFWAVLNDFALVLSAFQLRRVSARGEGQGMGQPAQQVLEYLNIYWYGWAQQVLEYLLVWLGPASIGEIYGIFSLSLSSHDPATSEAS